MDGDDGDGGKEDNSDDACNKDDKGNEDKDKCLDMGMTIMTKPTSLLKEHCTTHRENRTTDGDDGNGGKEYNSNDACNKDDKGNEDKDKCLDTGMTIMTKPTSLLKEHRTTHCKN